MNSTRIFIHGLEGSSQGTKARFFRAGYSDMIVDDFKGNLGQRMDTLYNLVNNKTPLIMVGSSYGGLMATLFAYRNPEAVKKLILLAPALSLEEFTPYLTKKIDVPVTIYHGQNDDIVPLAPVYDIAKSIFQNLIFNIVNDDHVLRHTFTSLNWDDLLESRYLLP
ncbi:MAG: alpha/beta fold hydrolase [Deltaproteobacteria bacterium]|nr:alpha/beta fold hydrolase [Deltaproteobacteria bacterium]